MMPIVNTSGTTIDWSTEINPSLFDISYSDHHHSAIDSFKEKNIELNKMIVDPMGSQVIVNTMIISGEVDSTEGRKIIAKLAGTNVNYKLMNLVLLGYVSSVEGYMRQLIKELVNLDKVTRNQCELKSINFGATYFQSHDMFPESLMDGVSFVSKKNIALTCKELLGIKLDCSNGSALDVAFNDFDSICQLRHCIVHRFGKIGATNAIKLGLNQASFGHCLEKPVSMSYATIQKVSKITTNLVRELNQFIWERIMNRLIENDPTFWKWDYRIDRKKFKEYLAVFFEANSDTFEVNAKKIYDIYRDHHLN